MSNIQTTEGYFNTDISDDLFTKLYASNIQALIKNDLNEIEQIHDYGFGYANWALLLQRTNQPFYEVAFGGSNAIRNKNKLNEHYLPMKVTAPVILKNKIEFTADKNETDDLIYVCRNHSCLLPTSDIIKVAQIITGIQ